MIDPTPDHKKILLHLARFTIAKELKADYPEPEIKTGDPFYDQRCGAFVTLHKDGSLRGCIGYIVGKKDVINTVIDMAKAAAFRDPRFSPVKTKELGKIDIEISLLSPIEDVTAIEDIVVGRDGLIISQGHMSGLLLPQVPTEQGWDRDQFLSHTCLKAGLNPNAWHEPETKIEKFSAIVFGENDIAPK